MATYRLVQPGVGALLEFASQDEADKTAMGYLMDYSSDTPQLVLEHKKGRLGKWKPLGVWERPTRETLPVFRELS